MGKRRVDNFGSYKGIDLGVMMINTLDPFAGIVQDQTQQIMVALSVSLKGNEFGVGTCRSGTCLGIVGSVNSFGVGIQTAIGTQPFQLFLGMRILGNGNRGR
jgi:hypothetical protein